MYVINHRDYASTDYEQSNCSKHKLGDVVINMNNEIGVIIQVRSRGQYRTDMFGNCSINEILPATYGDVLRFRPNIHEDSFRNVMDSIGNKIKT